MNIERNVFKPRIYTNVIQNWHLSLRLAVFLVYFIHNAFPRRIYQL